MAKSQASGSKVNLFTTWRSMRIIGFSGGILTGMLAILEFFLIDAGNYPTNKFFVIILMGVTLVFFSMARTAQKMIRSKKNKNPGRMNDK
jgi:hypothetical protein